MKKRDANWLWARYWFWSLGCMNLHRVSRWIQGMCQCVCSVVGCTALTMYDVFYMLFFSPHWKDIFAWADVASYYASNYYININGSCSILQQWFGVLNGFDCHSAVSESTGPTPGSLGTSSRKWVQGYLRAADWSENCPFHIFPHAVYLS